MLAIVRQAVSVPVATIYVRILWKFAEWFEPIKEDLFVWGENAMSFFWFAPTCYPSQIYFQWEGFNPTGDMILEWIFARKRYNGQTASIWQRPGDAASPAVVDCFITRHSCTGRYCWGAY